MRTLFLLSLSFAVACAPPSAGDGKKKHKQPAPKTVTGGTDDTDTDTDTDDTDTDTDVGSDPANVCPAILPDPDGTYNDTQFTTEEDFDFDGGGYMLSQSGGNIAALDRNGGVQIIAVPGFQDPSGLRVASTGDIVLAEPDMGTLRIVYRANGATENLVTGMVNTNGVAADSLGYIAFSDFTFNGRVGLIDLATFDIYEIAPAMNQPNGLQFSQDEQRLLIVTTNGIMESLRLGDTDFAPPTPFTTFPEAGSFWSIAMDVCDRIYTVNYSTGKVWRADADGSNWTPIVDVAQWGSFSSLRFGGGQGGWDRDVLYVTSRAHLYGVPIGVNGVAAVAPIY